MAQPDIKYCPGNLSPIKNDLYSLAFRKEMFGGAKVRPVLGFPSPGEYLSAPEDIALAAHLSISGVQSKFKLHLEGAQLLKAENKGAYIIKPIPVGIQRAEEVPSNEHLTMQIARQVYQIDTAINGLIFYSDGVPAYITRRFDYKADGTKYRQEDFAQLAERTEETHGRDYKYEFSYEEMGLLIRKYIPAYMPQLERFFRLVVFNYLFSNGDAHLKNFSVLETPDGDHILSPAYDLLCSRLHSPNERDMAPGDGLFTDYETESFQANGFYAYDDFYAFGIQLGLIPKRVERHLTFFKQHHLKVDELISRSYLSEPVKKEYLDYYVDRLTRLNHAFTKRNKSIA